MWDKLNTSFKYAVILALVALGVWLYYKLQPSPSIGISTGPGLPVQINRPVSENHPSVPAPKKKQGGTLVIITQPKDPTAKPDTLTVIVPRNPREDPPTVFGDSGRYTLQWTVVREPHLEFATSFHVGASFDTRGNLSPWLGVGFVRVFGVDAGACTDLYGGGLFAGVEVLPSLNVDVSYRILKFDNEYPQLALSLAYRF